ncbi:MAG: hypothetical protein AAGI34_07895 [Pseudomonadota bacterium]
MKPFRHLIAAALFCAAVQGPAQAAVLAVETDPPVIVAAGTALNLPGVLDFNLEAEGPGLAALMLGDLSVAIVAEVFDETTAGPGALSVFAGGTAVVLSDRLDAFAADLNGGGDRFDFLFSDVSGVLDDVFADGLVATVVGDFGPDPFGIGFGVFAPTPVSVTLSPVVAPAPIPLPPSVLLLVSGLSGVLLLHRRRRGARA